MTMSIPDDRKYTAEHEWAQETEEGVWIVGVTDFAQDQLGDITLVELPEVGDEVEAGEVLGTVDSVKTFSDLFSPVSGEITEINEAVLENPEVLNQDPYGDGWLVKIRQDGDLVDLMDKPAYSELLDSLQ
jgi:glycine cleavage system H protein